MSLEDLASDKLRYKNIIALNVMKLDICSNTGHKMKTKQNKSLFDIHGVYVTLAW